jgi:dipeptidyl aminopeptidase/acylaminoacyl peptidase
MGIEPQSISPYHHVKPGAPPTLILHGKADMVVPFKTVEWFTDAMTKAGNRCELVGSEGAGHGFFNFGRDGNKSFVATLERADRFLSSLGYLRGEPTVETFLQQQSSAD